MSRIQQSVAFLFLCLTTVSVNADWQRFRGPNGTGVAESAAPVAFGENRKIQWKTPLPGRGVSSPIVVGDMVFVTCYSGYGMGGENEQIENLTRHLVCLDRTSGDILWKSNVAVKLPEDPFEGIGVPRHGYASQTPVSDGENVFAFFGKSGVYAYDFYGNELWNQSVGTGSGPRAWGSSASPIANDEAVIVNASDESESIVWLDKKTGEEKFRAGPVDGLVNVWGTPVLVNAPSGQEVVIAASGEIWGLNASSGKLKWYATGGSEDPRSSCIVDGEVVYVMNGSRGGVGAVALEAGGSKDVSESNTVWKGQTSTEYGTPVLHDGHLYSVSRSVMTCLNAETGERVYQKRLDTGETVGDGEGEQRGGMRRGGGGGMRSQSGPPSNGGDYASPVLADGKIYVTTDTGVVYVVAAKPEFELIATNDMTFDNSGFGATPAISDGQLFLRSHTHLYCIGDD
ncbi:PQQ-binding-like beta-propeller repeat protein [Thalassoglobus sp. JC818]|uniref:outer membrane protein assembly factor BamB family protein n=1 Tax=Thalassoglobus sp. JC818 TaxID=3232136 RepID=UPI00345B2EB3